MMIFRDSVVIPDSAFSSHLACSMFHMAIRYVTGQARLFVGSPLSTMPFRRKPNDPLAGRNSGNRPMGRSLPSKTDAPMGHPVPET